MSKKIAVVGGGIAGLVSAYELQKLGHIVTVFEPEPIPGGRMATVIKEGLFADTGANFFRGDSKNTRRFTKELGVPYYPLPQKEVWYLARNTQLTEINFLNGITSWKKFLLAAGKSIWYRPPVYDINQPYGTERTMREAALEIGQEFHDYIIEPLVRALMFYDTKELPEQFLWANFWQTVRCYFVARKVIPRVSDLPLAFAKHLSIAPEAVIKIISKKNSVTVSTAAATETFDLAIIAAPITSSELSGAPEAEKLLDSVHYAPSIVMGYRVPAESLAFCSMIGIPFSESRYISILTNEGRKLTHNGKAIMGLATNEEALPRWGHLSDQELDTEIRKELIRVIPSLKKTFETMELFAIKRWKGAIPKYPREHVRAVQKFWEENQGKNNIYLAGDYMNHVFVEGAVTSGLKVVELIKKKTPER